MSRFGLNLPEDEDREIHELHRRIGAEVRRDRRDLISMITVCLLLGMIVMGFIALFRMNHDANPLGFVIGAVFLAIMAFMIAAD